jgi:hypothetical protein
MHRALTGLAVGIIASILMWDSTGAQSSPLSVLFTVDRYAYQPGEPITFTIRVQNVSNQPVAISFATAQRFDVIIQSDVTIIDRWSSDRTFAQARSEQTWRPGETISYEDSWLPSSRILPGSVGAGPRPLTRGLFEIHAEITGIAVQPSSPSVPIVVGSPILLDTGCTELPETVSLDVSIETVARTVEPRDALKTLWQQMGRGSETYAAYSPRLGAISNLANLTPREPIIVCVDRPSEITLP